MASSISGIGKTEYSHAKERNWNPILYYSQKINLKPIKNLNVRPETIKVLEENRGKLLVIGLFFWYYTKSTSNKAKISKWGYIKLKISLQAKEMINRMNRQLMEQEKIFANHISDKRLIFIIYKEVLPLNRKSPQITQLKSRQKTWSNFFLRHTKGQMIHEKNAW